MVVWSSCTVVFGLIQLVGLVVSGAGMGYSTRGHVLCGLQLGILSVYRSRSFCMTKLPGIIFLDSCFAEVKIFLRKINLFACKIEFICTLNLHI